MYSKAKNFLSTREIIGYTLPRIHRGKSYYVDFFAYDPTTDRLKRKRYMLDRYHNRAEREKIAAVLVYNLTHKLLSGWNPFVNTTNTRQYTELGVVFDRYITYIEAAEKKGILKPKTATDYRSRLKQLSVFTEEIGAKIKYAYQLNTAFAVDFLDYLILDKDLSAKSRNNYRTWLSTFCTWLAERKYIDRNPIESIHMLREDEKLRSPLEAKDLRKVREWTQQNNPSFYLACMMEYYTFIRPDELRYIKIGDISITEQSVYISESVAKNRKGQVVALNDTVLKLMIEQHIFDYPSQDYLFGANMTPGPQQIYVNRFRQEWNKMRKALNFPASYQFYSLKDSGIRDLANAQGIVVARDQARHSDISVTNKYLKRPKVVHEETKHFVGDL